MAGSRTRTGGGRGGGREVGQGHEVGDLRRLQLGNAF